MKKLIILPAIIALTGCDSIVAMLDNHIKDCKKSALAIAKSPSTVDFVDAYTRETSKVKTVYLAFDSQNSFGGVVRTKFQCKYPGEKASGGYIRYEERADTVFINGVEADLITMLEIQSARLAEMTREYQ